MRVLSTLAFAALPLLAACATEQERCKLSVTRDLRTLDRLITELERDVARGFTIVEEERTRTVWEYCEPVVVVRGPDGKPLPQQPKPRMCMDDETYVVERPQAIDVAAERRKLAGLKQQRAEVNRRASAGVAQCERQFPETEG